MINFFLFPGIFSVKNLMNNNNLSVKFTILLLFLFLGVNFSFAQAAKLSTPARQEKLLNGMKLLVWTDAAAPKVTVKLRVHSGSAFDALGKEGTMALLADALFPTEATREFFTEDLGGSLEVSSNYDYIQVTATSSPDQFLTMLETIAAAVTNPPIDKETTAKIRVARIDTVKELEKNPSYVADQAVAKRLFGDFPYGRPQTGTSQSLAKIDFADLLLAKQKFFTSDNATLAVVGSVKSDLVYRATRRLFGSWTQADKKIPASFRQPEAPAANSFLIKSDAADASELRFAFRGLARSEKDFAASQILVQILQKRLQMQEGNDAAVRQHALFLPGLVVIQIPKYNAGKIQVDGNKVALPVNFFNIVADLFKKEIKSEEVENARSILNAGQPNAVDLRLDADTYKFDLAKDESQNISGVALADVQRVAERWRKEPVATALVIKSAK